MRQLLEHPILIQWREKIISLYQDKRILWGTVLGGVCLLLLIWNYTSGENELLQDKIVRDQKLVLKISQMRNEINTLKNNSFKPVATKPSSILTVIDQASKAAPWNKYPMNMKQGENNQVEVTFERINFDDLIKGTEMLWKKNGIEASKVSLQRIDPAPYVKVSIVFE